MVGTDSNWRILAKQYLVSYNYNIIIQLHACRLIADTLYLCFDYLGEHLVIIIMANIILN